MAHHQVQDDTDLTTLVGPAEKYSTLVKKKFVSEYGNLTWGDAKTATYDDFLADYSSGEPPVVKHMLAGWIAHYNLETQFKKRHHQDKQQQQNESYMHREADGEAPSDSSGCGRVEIVLAGARLIPTSRKRKKKDGTLSSYASQGRCRQCLRLKSTYHCSICKEEVPNRDAWICHGKTGRSCFLDHIRTHHSNQS